METANNIAVINTTLTYYFKIAGVLALLAMIWASIVIMTSQGDTNQAKYGWFLFKKAVIGLFVIGVIILLLKIAIAKYS